MLGTYWRNSRNFFGTQTIVKKTINWSCTISLWRRMTRISIFFACSFHHLHQRVRWNSISYLRKYLNLLLLKFLRSDVEIFLLLPIRAKSRRHLLRNCKYFFIKINKQTLDWYPKFAFLSLINKFSPRHLSLQLVQRLHLLGECFFQVIEELDRGDVGIELIWSLSRHF